MTESTIFNLESFVEFLKKNNFNSHQRLNKFSEVVKFFDNSLGGCGCNKNTRVKFANDFYFNFIKESTDHIDGVIFKELSFSKQIVFVDKNNTIIKQF
jgi:hypothetical protein